MTTEQLILDRLDAIEGMLRRLLPEQQRVVLTDGNDFIRAKRAALEARDRSQQRRTTRKTA